MTTHNYVYIISDRPIHRYYSLPNDYSFLPVEFGLQGNLSIIPLECLSFLKTVIIPNESINKNSNHAMRKCIQIDKSTYDFRNPELVVMRFRA